jgi:hypothetical protein
MSSLAVCFDNKCSVKTNFNFALLLFKKMRAYTTFSDFYCSYRQYTNYVINQSIWMNFKVADCKFDLHLKSINSKN